MIDKSRNKDANYQSARFKVIGDSLDEGDLLRLTYETEDLGLAGDRKTLVMTDDDLAVPFRVDGYGEPWDEYRYLYAEYAIEAVERSKAFEELLNEMPLQRKTKHQYAKAIRRHYED